MNIKIDFQKMQQDALINKLKLNEYLYIIGKVKEYKASTEKQGAIDIVVSFKKTYILYYDMGIYCYKDK